MIELMSTLGWALSSLIIVACSAIFYSTLLLFVRKKVAPEVLKKHHDVAGFAFSVIGILYSVLLGFVVVNAQNRYDPLCKQSTKRPTSWALCTAIQRSLLPKSATASAERS